jgi:hypothetical protein
VKFLLMSALVVGIALMGVIDVVTVFSYR